MSFAKTLRFYFEKLLNFYSIYEGMEIGKMSLNIEIFVFFIFFFLKSFIVFFIGCDM